MTTKPAASSGGLAPQTVVRGALSPLHKWSALIAVLMLIAIVPASASSPGRWEVLQAIHWVENPLNSTRPGPHGELGAYQFLQATWMMYTKRPFSEARNRQRSDEVAVQHYEWIKTRLAKNGLEASVYNIALAWNAGVSATINGRAPRSSHAYATRVANLATELRDRQLAAGTR